MGKLYSTSEPIFIRKKEGMVQIEASGGAKQMIETILVVKKAKDEQMKQSSPVQAIEDSEKAQTREVIRKGKVFVF